MDHCGQRRAGDRPARARRQQLPDGAARPRLRLQHAGAEREPDLRLSRIHDLRAGRVLRAGRLHGRASRHRRRQFLVCRRHRHIARRPARRIGGRGVAARRRRLFRDHLADGGRDPPAGRRQLDRPDARADGPAAAASLDSVPRRSRPVLRPVSPRHRDPGDRPCLRLRMAAAAQPGGPGLGGDPRIEQPGRGRRHRHAPLPHPQRGAGRRHSGPRGRAGDAEGACRLAGAVRQLLFGDRPPDGDPRRARLAGRLADRGPHIRAAAGASAVDRPVSSRRCCSASSCCARKASCRC